MAEDVPIMFLPNEITELILEDPRLNFRDVVNFGVSCKHLQRIVFSDSKVWRTKFFQRWPVFKEIYDEYEQEHKVEDWLQEVQASFSSKKALMHELSLMSAKYYKKQELSHSELKNFDILFRPEEGAHPMAYHFIIETLIDIIEQPIGESNLTTKYYASKVVRYIKQSHLKDEWEKYLELPLQKQLLEVGAAIVAQWSQPEKRVSYAKVREKLDDIAQSSKEVLKERHPGHSIFSTSPKILEQWRITNIDDNQWSTLETKQIMAALCQVMFNKLGFHGNSEMYYSSENSFIDRVLEVKHGIPITLAIVFESACRRVGVKCEPVSFPAHFLLRWKERYTDEEDDKSENFYIDVFNGGQFLTTQSCPRLGGISKCPIKRYNTRQAATPVEVVERMAHNLEVAGRQRTHLNGRAARLRSALELELMVRPLDTNVILHLARFYMLNQLDLAALVSILTFIEKNPDSTARGPANHILQMLYDYEKHMNVGAEDTVEIKKRTPEVKYAVGMIMKHQRYEYLCVITGWDLRCEASPEWMIEMGVEELHGGSNQPFYNVFANDGSSRYAAQENLIMAVQPGWVDHFEIGRYFCKFNGTHYLPNEEKSKEYPEDAEIRENLLSKYL